MSKYHPPTKCEVLLTRRCPFECWYCRMKRYNYPEMTPEEWSKVPYILDEMGVKFAPVYGAEPLAAYKSLLSFVKSSRKVGLPISVITNAKLLTQDKMRELVDVGLDSVTFSYDIIPLDEFTEKKKETTERVLENAIRYFNDVEIVVTLYEENYQYLPQTVERFTDRGIWVHFDFYHPDRGQEGSKCAGNRPAFNPKDIELISDLKRVLETIKDNPYLHPRPVMGFIIDNLEELVAYKWKCIGGSWITLDSDGSVFGCDDFQPSSIRNKFHILSYCHEWDIDTFIERWRNELVKCTGCAWITHIMSDIWWMGKDASWVKDMTHNRIKEVV